MLNYELKVDRSVERGVIPTKNLLETVGDSLPFSISSPIAVILHPTSLKL